MVYSRRACTIAAGGQGAGDQIAPHGGGRAVSVAAGGQTQIAGGHWGHRRDRWQRGQRRSAGLRCLDRRRRLWRHADGGMCYPLSLHSEDTGRRQREFLTHWNWYFADDSNWHKPQESSGNSISIVYKAETQSEGTTMKPNAGHETGEKWVSVLLKHETSRLCFEVLHPQKHVSEKCLFNVNNFALWMSTTVVHSLIPQATLRHC